jgi:hypothetical protein
MPILEYGPFKPERVQLRIIIISCLYILFFPKIFFAAELPTEAIQAFVSVQPFKTHEKEKYNLQVIQPYRFDKTTLIKTMSSLAYQKRGVSWSNKRRVFNSVVVKKLVPMILEKFSLAGPDQRITFQVKNETGKKLLKGDTFLTTKGLHWRMTAIQKTSRTVDDFSVSGDPWRLVPLNHQSYKTKENIKNLVQDITNWIVFNQIKPHPERIMRLSPLSKEKHVIPAPLSLSIKDRLKTLEDLKHEGLIDEEEYNVKRQEILDAL